MKKVNILKKCILLIAVTILVIVAAWLPKIVAFIQDKMNLGQAGLGQMQSVELDIQMPLSPMEKLSLLKNTETCIEIPMESVSMSEADVEAVLEMELSKYVDLGILSPSEIVYYEYRPLFLMNQQNPKQNWTVWDCVLDTKQGVNVAMAIDDATGKCYVSQIHTNQSLEVNQEQFLDIWTKMYFSSLEILNYEDFEQDHQDLYIGEKASARYYSFADEVYGKVNMRFIVYQYGFYMDFEFPESSD